MKPNDSRLFEQPLQQGWYFSIGLHGFCLVIGWMVKTTCDLGCRRVASSPGLPAYTIQVVAGFNPTPSHTSHPQGGKADPCNDSPKKQLHAQPMRASIPRTRGKRQPNRGKQVMRRQVQKKATGSPKIDQRGLYHCKPGAGKQTGAMLELDGWKWDRTPQPEDTTHEYGKLVFEIKVDQHGEIVAIRTLEKTVSPLVVQIYVDALRALTFSRLSTAPPSAELSVGRVAFFLVAK